MKKERNNKIKEKSSDADSISSEESYNMIWNSDNDSEYQVEKYDTDKEKISDKNSINMPKLLLQNNYDSSSNESI